MDENIKDRIDKALAKIDAFSKAHGEGAIIDLTSETEKELAELGVDDLSLEPKHRLNKTFLHSIKNNSPYNECAGVDINKRAAWKITKDDLRKILNSCNTMSEAAQILGIPYYRILNLSKRYKIKFGDIKKQRKDDLKKMYEAQYREAEKQKFLWESPESKISKYWNKHVKHRQQEVDKENLRYPIEEILDGKHPEYSVYKLRRRLIELGVKQYRCEECGYSNFRITDKQSPILLTFIDGNTHNHRLNNLKMMCYNCAFLYYDNIFKCLELNFPDVYREFVKKERYAKNSQLNVINVKNENVDLKDAATNYIMGNVSNELKYIDASWLVSPKKLEEIKNNSELDADETNLT